MLDKILCVDDDVITLMLFKKVIERVGFAKVIITAQNGEEALEYFDTLYEVKKNTESVVSPKLVILDLNMPVMTGWELLDAYMKKGYHNIFQETKFMILSSSIDPEEISKSKNYPVVLDFLSKPITKEMLENLKSSL